MARGYVYEKFDRYIALIPFIEETPPLKWCIMNRVEILGVQIDNLSWDQALERIREMMRSGEPHQVITPAIEQVMLARRDAEFRRVLADADLVVADGMQVVFASRLHKTPLKARITGVDLVPAICRIAVEEDASVFFFGGEEGIAQEAAQCLHKENPGLRVAGTYFPPFGFEKDAEENRKAIEAIEKAKPQVLFVALGCPKQEKWIRQNRDRLGASVMIGIGGAFNMITGREKRAPQWMQQCGMEGLYRLFLRPKTVWRRIAISAPNFFLLLIDLFTYRMQKRAARWARPVILGLMDALLTPMAFLFSCWFYFRSGIFSNNADPFAEHQSIINMPAYSDLLLAVSFLTLFSLWFYKLYEQNKYLNGGALLIRIFKSSLTIVFLLICFQFIFFKGLFRELDFSGYSRAVFGFFGIFSFVALYCWRWLFFQFERWLHRHGINLDRIILVGSLESAACVAQSLSSHPEWGNQPLGAVCPNVINTSNIKIPLTLDLSQRERGQDGYLNDIAINPTKIEPKQHNELDLGKISDLKRLLPARKVDEVLIVDANLAMEDLHEVVRLCLEFHVKLSVIPSIHELLGVSSEIKQMGDYQVITVALDQSTGRMLE